MSYVRTLLVAAGFVASIGVIEAAVYSQSPVVPWKRQEFLPWSPAQNYANPAERTFVYTKIGDLDLKSGNIFQIGDSSGFYSMMPDVVDEYLGGLKYVNLSCCNNYGWNGYLAVLEHAIQTSDDPRAIVIHTTNYTLTRAATWRRGPVKVNVGQGNTSYGMGDILERILVSAWSPFSPPSGQYRGDVIQKVALGIDEPVISWNRVSDDIIRGIKWRAGYGLEHDTERYNGCNCRFDIETGFDWSRLEENTLFERAVDEFVALARKYDVVPILFMGPTPCTISLDRVNESSRIVIGEQLKLRSSTKFCGPEGGDPNALPRLGTYYNVMNRINSKYPDLMLAGPTDVYPATVTTVAPHMQRSFAEDFSRRLGEMIAVKMDIIDEPRPKKRFGTDLRVLRAIGVDPSNLKDFDYTDAVLKTCTERERCAFTVQSVEAKPPFHNMEVWFRCGESPIRIARGRPGVPVEMSCPALTAKEHLFQGSGLVIGSVEFADNSKLNNSQRKSIWSDISTYCGGRSACTMDFASVGALIAREETAEVKYWCAGDVMTKVIGDSEHLEFTCDAPSGPQASLRQPS